MRKIILAAGLLVLSAALFAEKTPPESKYSFEYREIAQKLQGPSAPFEKDGSLVFSAKEGPRYVGIAFDFENYQIIHPLFKKTTYDEKGDRLNSWYFYILENIPAAKRIYYRMIIDGVWTTDPLNPDQYYDTQTGIRLSVISLERSRAVTTKTSTAADGSLAHFVYRGTSGKKVRLAGTFTNWDSWIYELKETSPGLYELNLPLPAGTYYYVYYIGTFSFPDSTNPSRAYVLEDSLPVSKLEIRD